MNKSKLTRHLQNLFFAIFIILIALTVFVSCENIFINSILPSRVQKTVKYESSDTEGKTYILVITGKTSRAAYTGTEGDSYVLTIKQQGQPNKESKGVVTTIGADGSLTLKPTKADSVPFGVSVSSGKMTAITGTITLDDGTTVSAPGEVTPLVSITFTSVTDMEAWLNAQPANTAATPYTIKLNVGDLGGDSYTSGSAGYVLKANPAKYVSLDLSGSTITSIVDSAFGQCTSLTGITIGNGVTTIMGESFSNCTSLISVTIGNGVTTIHGFDNCTNLTEINISAGNSAYSSQDGVLYNKDKTTLITYPEGKTGAFTIPDSVTSISYRAFIGCTGLTSVTIGSGVTSIGAQVFSGCTSLTAINVDTANTVYSSQDGVMYNKDKTTLIQYPEGKTGTFTIPTGVTSIESYAFSECTRLTSVTITDSVTSIGTNAFSGCTGLASVTIGNGVTSIGNYAFSNCSSLASVTIGNRVTSIGDFAFYSCTSLASVTIPDSVTSIGTNAFSGCTGLTSITIPDSVTSIERGTFSNCTSLANVTFQGTIVSGRFDTTAFNGLGDLRDKYLAGGIGTYTTTAPVGNSSVWTKE